VHLKPQSIVGTYCGSTFHTVSLAKDRRFGGVQRKKFATAKVSKKRTKLAMQALPKERTVPIEQDVARPEARPLATAPHKTAPLMF
jgi:hypothetical protein